METGVTQKSEWVARGGEKPLARIAVFLPSLGGGGAERVLVYLANALAGQRLQVDLVAVHASGPYVELVSPKVRVVDLRASRAAASLPALVRYLRRERPTALLSTLNHTNAVAIMACRVARCDTRVVIRIANMLGPDFARARGMMAKCVLPAAMRLTYRYADHVIAVSSEVASDVAVYTGLKRDRVSVIYNPVPVKDLRKNASVRLDHPWFRPGEPPVVLGVGRLARQKDFPTLIRAFGEVLQRREARLVILGEGEERPRLEAMIGELGLDQHLALPGFVKNPYPYMARASVFVLSSAWEGFPNVLVETMALGTPVVSTDCPGGPREILDDGRFGILVPVGDEHRMAGAIQHCLDNGKRVRVHAQERAAEFDPKLIAIQYAQVLRDD